VINLSNLLFLDIETVAGEESFTTLSPRFQHLWKHKHHQLLGDEHLNYEASYFTRAGIYAEFGKIICIGLGFLMYNENKELCIKVKVISGDDEKKILENFRHIIVDKYKNNGPVLCAHNGKEFDYPYLCRRMLIHAMKIPPILNYQDKKPWEVKHYDTLALWKFGDRKAYTSLELLAAVFNIETSKSGIDGSKVNEYYYLKQALPLIAQYCARDVVVLIQIFLAMNGINKIENNNVVYL
jgi:predicted PolB exonuclease-like 3'-5' exonuclease